MREAEAIVALMRHDGIRAIVPLWRNDAGNNGLHDSVQIRFQALGGTVAQGFRYEPATSDLSTATALQKISKRRKVVRVGARKRRG